MDRERRKHARLHIIVQAELQFENKKKWHGTTKDISFGGAFVECSLPDSDLNGKTCSLQLTFNPESEIAKTISFTCRQIRTDADGIAVQLIATELFDYKYFEKFMIYNSPEPEKLADELDQDPGLIVKS